MIVRAVSLKVAYYVFIPSASKVTPYERPCLEKGYERQEGYPTHGNMTFKNLNRQCIARMDTVLVVGVHPVDPNGVTSGGRALVNGYGGKHHA